MPLTAHRSVISRMAEPAASDLRRNCPASLSWHRVRCHLDGLDGFLMPRFVTSLLMLGGALALGLLLLS